MLCLAHKIYDTLLLIGYATFERRVNDCGNFPFSPLKCGRFFLSESG